MADSVLTKHQAKVFGPVPIEGWSQGSKLTAKVRFDDECGNGHNTFAITGEIRAPRRSDIEAGGCLHDEIAAHFPELVPLLKWHLCSTDGPMHYLANTEYHVRQGKLDWARSSAIWPEASDDDLKAPDLAERLQTRLPALMAEFQAAVESLGFTW